MVVKGNAKYNKLDLKGSVILRPRSPKNDAKRITILINTTGLKKNLGLSDNVHVFSLPKNQYNTQKQNH